MARQSEDTLGSVTKKELRLIASDLRSWMKTLMTAHREADGVVRDPKVLQEMARLRLGAKLLLALNGAEPTPSFPPRIETGVPIPQRQIRDCDPRPKWTVLLRKMKFGDSVCVPANWAAGIVTSAHRIGIRTSRQFIGQKVRIWRTS